MLETAGVGVIVRGDGAFMVGLLGRVCEEAEGELGDGMDGICLGGFGVPWRSKSSG